MFRTEINLKPSLDKITLSTPILSIGSCFSDCMGLKFSENKFTALANPFGTVYNPLSIFKLLSYSLNNIKPTEETYLNSQGLFANYDFHSSFSSLSKEEIVSQVNGSIAATHEFIKNSRWLIITFGTAFAYRRADNQQIVANCHKVPARSFTKELLTQKQILNGFDQFYRDLQDLNKDINIILTVSPVRHIKDTLPLNSVSKANLRVACDTITQQHSNVHYFPSYEIMMDDLRDYRFYKADMIHPNETAENYIWDQFSESYFDAETLKFIPQWQKIKRALQHRPFNPETDEHQKFVRETIIKLKELENKINVREEIKSLEDQLI